MRSPHAHARIRSIDISRGAARCPACSPYLTGADLLADGLKPLPHNPLSMLAGGAQAHRSRRLAVFGAPHYPLALDKVRFVGEAVAMVVAETVAPPRTAPSRSPSTTSRCPP